MNLLNLNLTPSDQRTLSIAAVLLVLIMGYLFIWEPLHLQISNLNAQINKLRHDKLWMTQTAAQVQSLKNRQTPHASTRPQTSLLSLTDRSIRTMRLSSYLRRVEPQNNDSVKVWFDEIPFDQLIQWAQQLRQTHKVIIEAVSASKTKTEGTVNASLTLIKEGA